MSEKYVISFDRREERVGLRHVVLLPIGSHKEAESTYENLRLNKAQVFNLKVDPPL